MSEKAKHKTVGYDSRLMSVSSLEELTKSLQEVTLKDTPHNLVDLLWHKDSLSPQPSRPSNKVIPLQDQYSGETVP